MSNSTYKSSFFKNSLPERQLQVRNNDTTTNINASTSFTEIPMNGSVDRNDGDWTLDGNGWIANFTGWVDAYGSVSQQSSSARTNVQVAFAINGVVRGPKGAQGYIRSTAGHNESTSAIQDGFLVTAGQKITLVGRRVANSGTVNQRNGESIVKLRREGQVGLLKDEIGARIWVWAEHDGALSNNDWQYSFGGGLEAQLNGIPALRGGKITRMVFNTPDDTGSCTIGIGLNGTLQSDYTVTVPNGARTNSIVFSTPLTFVAGQIINFVTVTDTGKTDGLVAIEIELDG
jgi:hypothetical protein